MPTPPYQLWEKEMIQLGLGIPVWHADPHDDYSEPIKPGDVIERVWVLCFSY
jgi:hypothetical protein